jgi:hypothetical protein
MPNPIKYISRTYNSIIADIDSDNLLKILPRWWKRIWAGVGDMLNRMIDAVANLAFLRTAFTRKATQDHLSLIDYNLAAHETSHGQQRFNINPSATFPFSITKEELAAITTGSLSKSSLRFESRADQVFNPSAETFTADAGTDQLTIAAVYDTGDLVRLTTTGTLPGGLSPGVNYWVIEVDSTHIKLAENLQDAYDGNEIDITSVGSGTHTITSYALKAECYQQETVPNSVIIGKSDAVSSFQEYNLTGTKVLKETVIIEINSVPWTLVTSKEMTSSLPTDKIYRLFYKSDGAVFIQFGGVSDGGTQYGAIPGNFDIYAKWASGGGIDSNVFGLNKVNIYQGINPDVVDTSNLEDMEGGKDEETIESGKVVGPLLLKAQSTFVTSDQGEILSLSFPGVTRVGLNRNTYGVLSCQILIVPTGGGLPTAGLRADLDTFLTNITILESIDVRVEDPTYIVVAPTSAFKVKSGFTFSDVKPFYDLCWTLYFSEITEEVIAAKQTSIETAISFINTTWSFTFTAADNERVKRIIDALDITITPATNGPRQFGETVQEDDIKTFILFNVDGIDYLTISAPSFPLNPTPDIEATFQIGTITTTEIP